jgi:DNA-binding response OmpR family regulator
MDGFGLAKWIRQNRKGLPVLIASGDTGKANVAHELCADRPFFKKPYELKMVVAQVRQMLGLPNPDEAKT